MNMIHLVRKFGDPMKRSTWQALGLVLVLPLALAIILWTALTAKPTSLLLPDEALLEAVMIDVNDLPASWSPENIEGGQLVVPNGIGRDVWFRKFYSQPWINIGEKVYVYQTTAIAKQGYEAQLNDYARFELQGWEVMPELTFSHHADEMHLSCSEGYINKQHHYVCSVVGRYGRVVIDVGGNIYDERWLTAKQFREVLIKADRKANQSRKEQ
jgi:hypothetical protein